MNQELNLLFEKLWQQYTQQNPSAKAIHNLFTSLGETVVNDHIAFRTINLPGWGIDALAKPFVKLGYRQAGEYYFKEKKLLARHFELVGISESPKIFISELLMEEVPDYIREIFMTLMKNKNPEVFQPLVLAGSIFGIPSYETYQKMIKDSEYAGWLYIHGFRVNHFTVSINALKRYQDIRKVNHLLRENGFELNESGGEVKGTPEVFLEQSSTIADTVPVQFKEGMFNVPGCYYEFARRYPDKSGKLFGGFIAGSADKIFESTDAKNRDKNVG